MKNKRIIVLITGVTIIGLLTVFVVYLQGGDTKNNAALTASESQTSLDQNVSMPPLPTAPVTSLSSANAAEATTIRGTHTANTQPATVTSICSGNDSANFDCYQTYYQNLVRKSGIAAAFTDLKARYSDSPYTQSQCHPLTHVIGRTAAEKFSKVSEAYTEGDSFCWSGYYHGVLETFAHRIGLTNLRTQINTICADLNTDGKYGFNYYNCVHGIGHGLMAITDDELFKSLNYCDGLAGDWEQQSCAGGVYMENIIADGLNHVTNYLDPKRPLYPCSDSPDKYKSSCYLMQTSYMLKINNGDFAKTFSWCRDAGAYQAICDQSLGRDASGRTVSDGPKAKAICDLGGTQDEKTNCVIGAVKDFISYFHSDKQALAFCALFDDPIKTTCLDTTTSYYRSF